MKTLVWFREDLRLADNPALHHAAQQGAILPVFIYPDNASLGAASQWWLHHSLSVFCKELRQQGLELILRQGEPELIIHDLVTTYDINQVVWNRVYSPLGIEQGNRLKTALQSVGIHTRSFNAQLLLEPSQVLNQQGLPYRVFTPFWKAARATISYSELLPAPKMQAVDVGITSDNLQDWNLLPSKPDWSGGIAKRWTVGESAAQARWQDFLNTRLGGYQQGRDFPSQASTSYLSPHLAFGEISPRQLFNDVNEFNIAGEIDTANANKFLSELGWREFSRYLLFHFPDIIDQSFNSKFEQFEWQPDERLLRAWQRGETGYPIIDAGMRELWETGYMHNRVRMLVASFLTKHCLQDWRDGAAWFWDTLVDADIANNTLGWQWVAGCGPDAAPYFRIFNPVTQGEKFDKQGRYVKHWLPELAKLPQRVIHAPWKADAIELAEADVVLGTTYPTPIIDLASGRERALAAYQAIK